MDLDAFTAVHGPEWDRLDALVRRRSLDGADADELVLLYQRTAGHLSAVRSAAPDPALISRLSIVLGKARTRIAGAHEPAWRDVTRFLVLTLPAALYRIRWWSIIATTAFLVVAVVAGVWVATTPEGLAAMGPPSAREEYVNEAFASYYDPSTAFALTVWTNNAWIAVQTIALGITGIFPALVFFQNSVLVGATGGMMAAYGELDVFLSLIAPHGLLEMSAIFVATAAGLRLFWAWVAPGERTRGSALAQETRSLATVAIGLAIALAVSGLIEGFVTGQDWPWAVKIAIGMVAVAAFWSYMLVLGRWAARQGETGDMQADHVGDAAPVVG